MDGPERRCRRGRLWETVEEAETLCPASPASLSSRTCVPVSSIAPIKLLCSSGFVSWQLPCTFQGAMSVSPGGGESGVAGARPCGVPASAVAAAVRVSRVPGCSSREA